MHSADEEAISVKVDGFLNGFVVDAVMFTKIRYGWSLFDLLVCCGLHRFFIFLEVADFLEFCRLFSQSARFSTRDGLPDDIVSHNPHNPRLNSQAAHFKTRDGFRVDVVSHTQHVSVLLYAIRAS